MNTMNRGVWRAVWVVTLGVLMLLTGCAGTIRQDARVQGDVSRVEGVSQVVALMAPSAAKLQVDNPQFNREELATRLRARLESRNLTAPAATHRIEIDVTDIRVRGAFAAIMFGFMAGNDHITGQVRVLDPNGQALRSFEISASYAFGGIAGGQDSVRMNWMYDKFADLAADELQKVILAPRIGAGSITPGSSAVSASSLPAPSSANPTATDTAPAPMPSLMDSGVAIDNVEAVPVSEHGRAAYREWLKHRAPRAFIVSENGWYYSVWGLKPPDPMEPTDPLERGMKRCRDAGRPNCTPCAVDDRVVYTKPGPTAAAH